jgi:hypothetical protein
MQREPSRPQPWEYKLVPMGNPLEPDVEPRANAMGRLGWELVAIDATVWVFKRPWNEDEPTGPLQALMEETIPLTETETAALATPS